MQATSTSRVDASATMELLMLRFDNPSGKQHEDRDLCDFRFGSDGSECDHMFEFGLDFADRCVSTLYYKT